MKELERLCENFTNAVFQKDVEAFVSLFDENVCVFDMWQKWNYNGIEEWKEMVKGWFGSLEKNRDVVTFSDIQIQSNVDMAFVSAFVRFTAVSEEGKELRYLENRLTWVARKKEEHWKIIHQHTSSPIDFETMKVILQR